MRQVFPQPRDRKSTLGSRRSSGWRRTEEAPAATKQPSRRPYETVGYVISGRAELASEGQTATLEPGDGWVVPADAEHRYMILEPCTAVEATSPPAGVDQG